jgi:uncharacterized protein (TIGR02452 family)
MATIDSSSIGSSNISSAHKRIARGPCSKLTFSRGWLIHIADETTEIAKVGYYMSHQNGRKVQIDDALQYSIENSVHYHSSHTFNAASTSPKFATTNYYVCYGSSLGVATKLHQMNLGGDNNKDYLHSQHTTKNSIGILNSASAKFPDKFLRGTISQEECICRASLLYPCLLQYKDRAHYFYDVNTKPKYAQSSSTCAIFCPRVPVIRQDTIQGELLDTPLFISIVSLPAPNAYVLGCGSLEDQADNAVPRAQTIHASQCGEAYETMTLEEAMHDRCFRALAILALHGCTDLVLCAFGCGVHGNNPHKIAACFKQILTTGELHGRFRTVAFAIQPSRLSNYEAFCQVFPNAQHT